MHAPRPKRSVKRLHARSRETPGAYLGIAMPHMCHIVDTVQILHAICIVQVAALAPDNVQRVLVVERCVGPNVSFPLGEHLCKWQVLLQGTAAVSHTGNEHCSDICCSEQCVWADVSLPLGQHLRKWQVLLLRGSADISAFWCHRTAALPWRGTIKSCREYQLQAGCHLQGTMD